MDQGFSLDSRAGMKFAKRNVFKRLLRVSHSPQTTYSYV